MARSASLFSQLLQHFPRLEFAALVREHKVERSAKGFTCWTQFVAMLFGQAARADSLREICNGLACCLGKLAHLGIHKAPKRSTLSYANEHRPPASTKTSSGSTSKGFVTRASWHTARQEFPLQEQTSVAGFHDHLVFTYRDLRGWLDEPFETPPELTAPEHFQLELPGLGQLSF